MALSGSAWWLSTRVTEPFIEKHAISAGDAGTVPLDRLCARTQPVAIFREPRIRTLIEVRASASAD
jgi:hypothetical protein